MRSATSILVVLILISSGARADERLREATETYWDREDIWNGVYVGLGAVNIGGGVALATREDDGLAGAGYPIIAVGGIQLLTGVIFLALSPGGRRDSLEALERDSEAFRVRERERIAPRIAW